MMVNSIMCGQVVCSGTFFSWLQLMDISSDTVFVCLCECVGCSCMGPAGQVLITSLSRSHPRPLYHSFLLWWL